MNKKDIAEIKKQFTQDRCVIDRICACYVDAEKQKKTELNQSFLTLSDEEMFKYFDIFRKSLSGTIGKNLMTMEFPLAEEEYGGKQEFLMKLRKSKLTNTELLGEFYDKIIELYDYPENYLIILIHGNYDIPGKSSDGLEMDDASEEVYEHILCCICPVNLSKAGLHYNSETNSIEDCIRDWIVELPDVGFLFPLFEERSTDIHGLLYYAKKAEKQHSEFVDQLLGCTAPLSPVNQKNTFNALLEETLEETCEYETVVAIHEKLNEIIEAQKEEPQPVVLTKSEVQRVLEECGASDKKMERFEEQYDLNVGEDMSLTAANITSTKKIEIKTPEVVVNVSPESAQTIETRILEGRRCLVIPLSSDVEVNGVHVNFTSLTPEQETEEQAEE
ncbi:MAG: DUF4317 domain-containing protein [Eubacteriales bacterium]|nr:DUF4317 domain-containing protein [Eubacteriales bacterium]